MDRKRLINGLMSLLFLIAGLCIYFFFRDLNNIILFNWIPKPEFAETVCIQLKPSFFSGILMFNFPDMLWFVSGILFLRFIWFYKLREQKIYVICFYIIGAVIELSQFFENTPGTFDILDLLFMSLGAFIEGILNKYKSFFVKSR